MQNKFLELASSPLMNLDHTYRYSGTKMIEAESLSQHIVDTIMMGLKVIDTINNLAEEELVSPSDYVMKAVYHDMEEVITGDIPRPLKYHDETTRDSLKNVAEQVAKKLFQDQFTNSDSHYQIWERAKEGSAGYILKIVDTLVVAHKVIKEVSLLHNYYVLRVAHEVVQYLADMYDILSTSKGCYFSDNDVNDYLLDIVGGAVGAMTELLDEHKDVMESLNIYGQSMI